MRRTALIAAAGMLSICGLAANTQEMDPAIDTIDTDGDGMFSLEELQTAHEEMTEELYNTIDTDGNGTVSPEEHQAALDAGTIGSQEL